MTPAICAGSAEPAITSAALNRLQLAGTTTRTIISKITGIRGKIADLKELGVKIKKLGVL